MDKTLFHGDQVSSSRIIYTPSVFAKENLIHVQEIGMLQAKKPHISKREHLSSYLFIMVESGSGALNYEGTDYSLNSGDCVFIDCMKHYSHETSDDLWRLKWIHFYGPTMEGIYKKYEYRVGKPCFTPIDITVYSSLFDKAYSIASSNDPVRDMRLNESLCSLLTLFMTENKSPAKDAINKQELLNNIKEYISSHYTEKITLDSLAQRYYINKFYLSHIFKEAYEVTVNSYLLEVRLTHAKQLLRFTDESLETIGAKTGIGNIYYFSRVFKKTEGISPSEYRRQWKSN